MPKPRRSPATCPSTWPRSAAASNYGLLELSRGFRAIGTHGLQSEVKDRVGLLATKLEANRRALDVQLRAVREITDIIAEAITEAESDGTYSLLTVPQ